MRHLITVFMVMIVIAAAGGLNVQKHRVETRRDAVRALERQIVADSEALRVLEAEWAYLTSPAALRERAIRHLRLIPVSSDSILPSPAGLPYHLDRLDIADAAADDIRRLPEPRMKPQSPAMPASLAAVTPHQTGPSPADFATRIAQAIKRGGGE